MAKKRPCVDNGSRLVAAHHHVVDVRELRKPRRGDFTAYRETLEYIVYDVGLVWAQRLYDDLHGLKVRDPRGYRATEVRVLACALLKIRPCLAAKIAWNVACTPGPEHHGLDSNLVGPAEHLLRVVKRRTMVGVRTRQPEVPWDEAVAASKGQRPLCYLLLLRLPPRVVLVGAERSGSTPFPEVVSEVAHYGHVLNRRAACPEKHPPALPRSAFAAAVGCTGCGRKPYYGCPGKKTSSAQHIVPGHFRFLSYRCSLAKARNTASAFFPLKVKSRARPAGPSHPLAGLC